MISVHDGDREATLGELARFRREFYGCLTARADALFELADAVLCTDGPVVSLPELSLTGPHRRGHGAMYDALACGRVEVGRLRMALAGLVLPRAENGQLRIAIDVTPWPRPDAECSPQRLHCHRYCRCDGVRQTIPGWPYSVAAALQGGRSSWVAPLDIQRIGAEDDVTDVTAAQIRGLHARLREAGQLREGDPPVLIVLDSGYDVVRLTWLLAGLPVRVLGRIRGDRVMRTPPPAQRPDPGPGRPPRHGEKVRLADPDTWPAPEQELTRPHTRYGTVHVRAFGRLHPQLERRGSWTTHPGPLPIVEASVILVQVQRLAHPGTPKPLWLWSSHPVGDTGDLDRLWRAYLRRFDLEHTFRFLKQTLGLTRPRLRTPEQADRWAWLLITAYTQLRLARHLTHDLRRPWDKPLSPHDMTPGRVRRGFRRIRRAAGNPASAPKPTHPGPGRPKGSRSTPTPRHPVGKNQPKPDTIRRNQYRNTHHTRTTG